MTNPIGSFIETRAVRRAYRMLDTIREGRGVGLLVAPAGAGKSAVLAAYACRTGILRAVPGVLLCRAEVVDTPLSIVCSLLGRLGIAWRGSTRDGLELFETLARQAKVEMLLVDEALCLARHTLEMLRLLRERTGLALVLAGGNRLPRRLRVACPSLALAVDEVHELAPVTLCDVLILLDGERTVHGRRTWERVAAARRLLEASEGNFGRLVRLLGKAGEMAGEGGGSVTPEIINAVIGRLQATA